MFELEGSLVEWLACKLADQQTNLQRALITTPWGVDRAAISTGKVKMRTRNC